MRNLKGLIDRLPSGAMMEEERKFVKTEIGRFTLDNRDCRMRLAESAEILRRYDEVLLEKASKISLTQEVLEQNMGLWNHFYKLDESMKGLSKQ